MDFKKVNHSGHERECCDFKCSSAAQVHVVQNLYYLHLYYRYIVAEMRNDKKYIHLHKIHKINNAKYSGLKDILGSKVLGTRAS